LPILNPFISRDQVPVPAPARGAAADKSPVHTTANLGYRIVTDNLAQTVGYECAFLACIPPVSCMFDSIKLTVRIQQSLDRVEARWFTSGI
jgi:hypothetical protein